MLAAFHILAPSNTLQHITEDSDVWAAETYDPKPSNSCKSVSCRFSEIPQTTPGKTPTRKWQFWLWWLFPVFFYILHFGCALKQSEGPFLPPEKYPKTTGSSLKREKRKKKRQKWKKLESRWDGQKCKERILNKLNRRTLKEFKMYSYCHLWPLTYNRWNFPTNPCNIFVTQQRILTRELW